MGTLHLPHHGPLLSPCVTFPSILPVHFGTTLGLRSSICPDARPQNRYMLLSYAIFTESGWWPFSTASSQTHDSERSDRRVPTCQCPYFSFEPETLMQISPGPVSTRSVSYKTPHHDNGRQVYTQYFRRLYLRNDYAPLIRHLHEHKVGPEHIRMKPHPYLACDRVYAVTGRNRPLSLYLSSLICTKAVVGYYYVSGFRPNGWFTVKYPFVRSSRRMLAVLLPDIPLAVFRSCTSSGSNRLVIGIHGIGIAFGGLVNPSSVLPVIHGGLMSDASVFGIIIWFAYSNTGVFRFSSLLRNVVTDATVYFIIAVCIQTLVLFFLLLADVCRRPLPILTLLTNSPSGCDRPIPAYVRKISPELKSLTNPQHLAAFMECKFH